MAASTALVIGAAFGAGCSEVGPDGVPASISFDALPYPAVVLGDSLRDADGVAAPLTAAVFDARNRPIPDAPVRFISLDPTVTISDAGHVTGESFGAARIVAGVDGLQTDARTLQVTRRPDRVRAVGDTLVPVEYVTPNVTISEPLSVRVVHETPPAPADTVVPHWIVEYEIVGQPPGGTEPGYLITRTTEQRASADTTETTGVAAVRFRLDPVKLTVLQDTLEVLARVRHRGAAVAGSPVRFLLLIRPRPAS